MVPRSQAIELDMSVDAAMKMIVTLGVVVPPPPAHAASPVHSSPGPIPDATAEPMRSHYCGQVNEQADRTRPSRSPAGCIGGAITAA